MFYIIVHQFKTIQLLNREPVPCQWSAAEAVKPLKKVHKANTLSMYMASILVSFGILKLLDYFMKKTNRDTQTLG